LLAFCAAVEVVSAEVLVEGAVFEHVISSGEDGSFPWCGRPPRGIG
jgi:hypothetical protein